MLQNFGVNLVLICFFNAVYKTSDIRFQSAPSFWWRRRWRIMEYDINIIAHNHHIMLQQNYLISLEHKDATTWWRWWLATQWTLEMLVTFSKMQRFTVWMFSSQFETEWMATLEHRIRSFNQSKTEKFNFFGGFIPFHISREIHFFWKQMLCETYREIECVPDWKWMHRRFRWNQIEWLWIVRIEWKFGEIEWFLIFQTLN